MKDIRLQRMAKVLIHYSLGIKKGDRLGIMTSPDAHVYGTFCEWLISLEYSNVSNSCLCPRYRNVFERL